MRLSLTLAVMAATLTLAAACAQDDSFQKEFPIKSCALSTTGESTYFRLIPGFQIVLENDSTKVVIHVTDRTKTVDGVLTRVVEEREWKGGELYEVALNYFAICNETKDAFYFGEDVDFYEDGKVANHKGSWLVGKDGAKPGMIMPGNPKVGMKYYQEVAPGQAMDRAEIVELDRVCKTPAGTFAKCMRIKEGTALNPLETEYKLYAPGIGLIGDEDLRLTKSGIVQ